MNGVLEEARRIVAGGRPKDAYSLVAPLLDLSPEPTGASALQREVAYLVLRSMPSQHDDGEREHLERWLLASAQPMSREVPQAHQILHAVGLSALTAARPRRALRAFARTLRSSQLSGGGRVRVADLACTALMDLGRFEAARQLALKERARAPHDQLDWLYLRRVALASQALGDMPTMKAQARECIEHPLCPTVIREELEPLLCSEG